jgi:hypothetical protein
VLTCFSSNFSKALSFANFGCFVNPAQAALSFVETRDTRLVMKDSLDTAVFFLTGLVEQCHLRSPYEWSYQGGTSRVHRLGLAPLGDEFRRAIDYLGGAFGVRELAGPIVECHINLSTRKEGAGTACTNTLFVVDGQRH